MKQYLVNKGHFNSSVHYVCSVLGKKSMKVVYYIHAGEGYHYRNVDLEIQDDSLTNLFRDWKLRTFLKTGEPYDVEILDAERLRITQRLQNQGYYFFNKDNIEFVIDSALNAYLMDVKAVVKPPEPGKHNEKYTYSDVYIFPDQRPNQSGGKPFDTTSFSMPKSKRDTTMQTFHFVHTEPLQIRPSIIASKLLIEPGKTYSLNNVDRTYENLLDLRVYRSTNVSIQPKPVDSVNPNYLLNTTIEVRQAPTWATETNFDLTTTSGLQGAMANTAIQNRNLFGGAEIFSLRLRGLVEVQYLFDKERDNFINNFDLKVDASIDFPRFIAPFNLRRTMQYRPRTLLNVGYGYQFRPSYYNRRVLNTSFGYSWRQPRVSHTLFPIDINVVEIDLRPDFAEKIDVLSKNNTRLRYQYADHFIFAARYSFSYTEQQTARSRSFNAFRFSLESSGNLLYLLSHLTGASKNTDNQYQVFRLAYSQYIRPEVEMKRYWYFSEEKVFVARLLVGSGFAYGNSTVLPYEKGFYAGGNNNIRGWPMGQLGPGSYYDSTRIDIERIGDIAGILNLEYRFPIFGAFKGALFVDAGNIWLRNESAYPKGEFAWKNIPNDLAVAGGIGLRWDLNYFIIRLDAALPLRNPANPDNKKWVVSDTRLRDIVLNFGIGYPF